MLRKYYYFSQLLNLKGFLAAKIIIIIQSTLYDLDNNIIIVLASSCRYCFKLISRLLIPTSTECRTAKEQGTIPKELTWLRTTGTEWYVNAGKLKLLLWSVAH